jgi:hypothetical protein
MEIEHLSTAPIDPNEPNCDQLRPSSVILPLTRIKRAAHRTTCKPQ